MEDVLLNGLPLPLVDIKEMDDCIIEEMNFTLTNEEIVTQWDAKIRRKLAGKLSVCKNEKVSEDILKDYIQSLKEQTRHFKNKKVLKEKISCHLKVFHLLYTTRENVGLYVVNHLDYIETILIVLCNLELEVIRHLKKNHVGKEYNKTVKKVARRLIDNLSINLLNEDKRIFHVLLKLDYKNDQSWKDVMDIVYKHYLINLPIRDRSDLSFCRYYLLFQKWKNITVESKHETMDKIMYLKFRKSHESILSNPLLKSILLPSTDNIVELLDALAYGQEVTVNAYFRYIEGNYEDDEIPAIELDSDEDEENAQQLLFAPSEDERRRNRRVKSEKNKSPVQENARYVEISSGDGQVVCVIDDDSDIEEVCVQDSRSNRRRKVSHKSASSRSVVSFLDSICLPDETPSDPPHTSLVEKEAETPLPPLPPPPPPPPPAPAEAAVLPLVTAYVNAARKRTINSLNDTKTQETSPMEVEPPSASVDLQKEVASLTNILNAVSCEDVLEDVADCTRITNRNSSGDSSDNSNNSVVQNVCVQSVVSFQSSDNGISKEVQSVGESEKCTCCCKHSTNKNSTSSNNKESETIKPSVSVTKPNFKTVEIQTDNIDSFNYLCGMITPPSDRTADENGPSSLENICPEPGIHNRNNGNTNVYAFVPSITRTDPYMESSPHNHYESDVETHSSNQSGVCESSTQVCNFDQPVVTQNKNTEDTEQSPIGNIQEQTNLKESLENLTLVEIEQISPDEEAPTEELANEIEVAEEPINEIQLNEIETVAKPEKQANEEDGFVAAELKGQTNNNEFNQNQTEEQANEHGFGEDVEGQANQSEIDETDAYEFNDICIEEEHEEELREEILAETVIAIEGSENEISHNQRSELEHCEAASKVIAEEDNGDHSSAISEEQQLSKSIGEKCASSEPENIVNAICNDSSTYANLTNVPIIIAQPEGTGLQESTIDISSFDLINTVILGEPCSPNKKIVLVPTPTGDGESTKFTVYKIATEVPEETLIENAESNQVYNGGKSVSTEQNKISNKKEPSVLKSITSEAQSCKIQASVTMAQLINKASPKPPKNGEHVKKVRMKNAEENADKIIFTSNERVKSAPLSLFAKFEQSQSDLVENAFSGPIEPINGKTNITCDNSNSNDSFCLFDSERSVLTKDFRDNSTPEKADSPLSPPYENIHAQEYETHHILVVNSESLGVEPKNVAQKTSAVTNVVAKKEEKRRRPSTLNTNVFRTEKDKKVRSDIATVQKEVRKTITGILTNAERKEERRLDFEPQNNFAALTRPSMMANRGASKRRRNDNKPNKKLKVNFGHTEIRFIPREQDRIVNENTTHETLEEYDMSCDDVKLNFLRATVLLKLNSIRDLNTSIHKLHVNSILNNLLCEKKVKAENSCIMTRVDYKKPTEDSLSKNRHVDSPFSLGYSLSAGSSVPSAITKRVDAPRIPTASPPSGYIPALNTPKSANGVQHSGVELVEKLSGNDPQPSELNTATCKSFSNEHFNQLLDQCNTEILNLTVPSKPNSPSNISLPESEFSRSPKFLPNPDQIVQQCLMESSEADAVVSMNNSITFLSNNSNFYTTAANQLKLKSSVELGCKTSVDDESLLKSEISKMIDENLKNLESETCLPFKKRRMPTLNEKLSAKCETNIPPFKEEISYPATPMISIAEIEALQQNHRNQNRSFKTPAERKEMPPLPVFYNINTTDPSPIITDQFNINNHTYNNPTINYHMSNVPVPFINVPCASYYSLPPILLPFNNIHHPFEATNVNQNTAPYNNEAVQGSLNKPIKKEKRKRSKKDKHCTENYYPDYKKSDSKIM